MLQVDITMLADHIMDASAGSLKQAMDIETDPGKVEISNDVRLLSGYLDKVERWVTGFLLSTELFQTVTYMKCSLL